MKHPLLKTLLFVVVLAAVVAAGALSFPGSPGAAAQEATELWLSSSEPPDDLPASAFSAPDAPQAMLVEPEVPTQIISHRITGTAVRPRSSGVDFHRSFSGGCIYAENSPDEVFNTPVWLPPGSTVDSLRMYYNDTSASNSTAWFTVYDLYGEIIQEWPVSSTDEPGLGFSDSDPIGHTIDYETYSYLLNWRPVVAGSTMQLCGFRIFYEPPPFGLQFLPNLLNND